MCPATSGENYLLKSWAMVSFPPSKAIYTVQSYNTCVHIYYIFFIFFFAWSRLFHDRFSLLRGGIFMSPKDMDITVVGYTEKIYRYWGNWKASTDFEFWKKKKKNDGTCENMKRGIRCGSYLYRNLKQYILFPIREKYILKREREREKLYFYPL